MIRFILIIFTIGIAIYLYDLVNEIGAIYFNFSKLEQQNCTFLQNFSTKKECSQLIAYKYKAISFKNNHFEDNQYYLFVYQLDKRSAIRFNTWFKQQSATQFDTDIGLQTVKGLNKVTQNNELISAIQPKIKNKVLPKLVRYCLNSNESCYGSSMRAPSNYYHQLYSYIVYGNDDAYWRVAGSKGFECKNNIVLDQKSLHQYFPKLYIPADIRDYQYLACWEGERNLLRLSSIITLGYLH